MLLPNKNNVLIMRASLLNEKRKTLYLYYPWFLYYQIKLHIVFIYIFLLQSHIKSHHTKLSYDSILIVIIYNSTYVYCFSVILNYKFMILTMNN